MRKKTDFSEKPYNRCLSCPHRGVRCDGPRTACMELPRWCEYMRSLKEVNGMTNAEIAELSGVSIKTIEKLMAGDPDQDIRRDTARRIENAIIGSSNQYPCYLAFEENMPDSTQQIVEATAELERALADNKEYRTALDNIHASYNAEMQQIRDEAQRKIDFLLSDIERLRADVEHWRNENDRKGKLIDRYMEKIVSK